MPFLHKALPHHRALLQNLESLRKRRELKDLSYGKRAYALLRTGGLEASPDVYRSSIIKQQLDHNICVPLDPTQLIFNNLQSGKLHHALALYYTPSPSVPAVPFSSHTLVALLRACAKLNEFNIGRSIHVEIIFKGLETDVFVGSTLVDMYAKCASLSEAMAVLGRLATRNVVSWNALAAGYAQHGPCEEVLMCLAKMQSEGVSPNAVTFTFALKACGSIEAAIKGSEVHGEILRKGYEGDLFLGSSLVDMYAKCGLLAEAKRVFGKLAVLDIVSWTALIAGYAEHGHGEAALASFQQMKQESVPPDAAIFTCVLKACGCILAMTEGLGTHTEIIKKGFEADAFVASTLVDMYVKCGFLSEALALVNKTPAQNVISWNALLAGYAEQASSQETCKCFQQMQLEAVAPNSVTYVCILKAFGSAEALEAGHQVHAEVVQKGFESDGCVGNSLVDFYAKCHCALEAKCLFTSLPSRDVVSWTAIISCAEHGPGLEVLAYLDKMQLESIIPDAAMFASLLKACGSLGAIEKGTEIHKKVIERSIESDLLVSNTLVDMYVKCGCIAEAQKAFDKLHSKNVVSWTSLIGGYADCGLCEEALKCYEQMQLEGIIFDSAIFTSALKSCASLASINKGHEIHTVIIQKGFEKDVTVGSAAVDMYSKCGAVLDASAVFNVLHIRAAVSWNALIAGFTDHGYCQEALSYFRGMQEKDVSPDAVTFVSILKACSSLGALSRGHEFAMDIVKRGFETDPFVGNSLVNMYAKCESLSEALVMFSRLPDRTVVSWNALISGYAEHGPGHEALNCFERMQKEGCCEASVTYICGLKACGNTGAIAKGRDIHKEILHKGLERDASISSTLIDMYAKCGILKDAEDVFHNMSARDVVAWNAMIKGYGLNHDGNMAIQYFESMQEHRVQPNAVTFIGLLTACSHTDLVLKGQEYFEVMQEKYKIVPGLDHYACLIDLHSRSGNLYKAEKVLRSLPFSPSKNMWLPLLTACKVYVEVELGATCFEKLVEMMPECATPYMLMATIYANAGRWDEVSRIEEMRKNAGAVKEPATAVIEVDQRMHEFVVGRDRSKEVIGVLGYLGPRMEVEGHVPDLDVVFRSIYDDGKEETYS